MRLGLGLSVNSTSSQKVGGFTGILDEFTGAAAAYSVRKLSSTYSGNAMRVRRSSDDTEQDIAFTGSGVLDTSSLLSFVGTGGTDNGFVTIWYDQSGNAKNALNTTESQQPKIVSAGSVVTLDGHPCLDGDVSGNAQLQASDVIDGAIVNYAIFSTYALKTTTDQITFNIGNETGSDRISDTVNKSGTGIFAIDVRAASNVFSKGNSVAVSLNEIHLNTIVTDTNPLFIDGVQQTASNSGRSGTASDNLSVFNRNSGGSFAFEGKFYEFIYFNSDQSSNRTNIEANINTHFSIF
jgi:hypothetical protein